MYYNLNKECKDNLVKSEEYKASLTPFIDDIWNLFDNKLPIEIIKFVRKPIL